MGRDGDAGMPAAQVARAYVDSVEGSETGIAADEEQADEHGMALAERLLDDGAASILAEVRAATAPVVPEP